MAKHKNGLFIIILARTRSVVIVGHLLMAPMVPASPKLRVLILVKWEWPKMAKNWGEPRKMTYS